MKAIEIKHEFIRLRAEGKSYDSIAGELHISKTTAFNWDKEFNADIAQLKRDELDSIYDAYHMKKVDRIERLGGTLARIEDALATADLSQISPDKLLELRLKYSDALQKEYTDTTPAFAPGEKVTADSITAAMADLFNRVKAGEISTEQANRESTVLSNLLKAYEDTELNSKLDKLEAILEGRNNA